MNPWLQPEPHDWWPVVEDALAEDVGSGDVTSSLFDPSATVSFYIEAQADGVVCGVGIAHAILGAFAEDLPEWFSEPLVNDGDTIRRGDRIIQGVLSTRRVLTGERTALNFLMFLSGVSTLTRQYVERIEGTKARLVDTRKTVPGLRSLQKYAVRCGGGFNHRMGLYDGVMIKDNHIMAAGSITDAVHRMRDIASHLARIEVECENLNQVEEAVKAGAEVVLLDNMDPFMMREAVKRFGGQTVFEASGGISLETVRGVAQTGVDYISVGALTHSAVALPFHLELE